MMLREYLKGLGLSDEWIEALSFIQEDPDDLDRNFARVYFPYIKSTREGKKVFLKIRLGEDYEFKSEMFIGYGLFSYSKKVLPLESGLSRFVQGDIENAKTTTDIMMLVKTENSWKLAILEGYRTKMSVVMEILKTKKAKGLRAPYKIVLQGILSQQGQFIYPTMKVVSVEEGTDFPLPPEPMLTLLKGHILWKKGEQTFSPLYPPTLSTVAKEGELEETLENGTTEDNDALSQYF